MSATAINPQRLGLKGYVTNRSFAGLRVPASMQSLLLRDYAQRNGLMFILPAGEFSISGCYLQLEGLFGELPKLEGVAMASMFMLPENSAQRLRIYEEFLKQGASLHFVLENIILHDQSQIRAVEEIFGINDVLKSCPKSIPREFLPPVSLVDSFSGPNASDNLHAR
jgi:sporadic carbohydrate cluster protein (TIGR04323 family)